MENNKGFTLVELLVVVAVIAALTIAVSLNTGTLTRGANAKAYKATYESLFNAALSYGERYMCNPSCFITLEKLQSEGLVDKNIYLERNPIFKDVEKKFDKNDYFEINVIDGKLTFIFYSKDGSCNIAYDDLENGYDWEACE